MKILGIYKFCIQFDSDYGIDKKSGWTVVINGIVMCELCQSLLFCLAKSFCDFYSQKLYEF